MHLRSSVAVALDVADLAVVGGGADGGALLAGDRPALHLRNLLAHLTGVRLDSKYLGTTCCSSSASKNSIRRFVIIEKAPTRAFSWLKAATTALTFETLLRHYAKRALTPWSLNVKLGPRRKGHKGRAGWLA